MRIIETYSHLNGLEFLLVHKPQLWEGLKSVIESIDANACKTKISKEKTMRGKELFSPVVMNGKFKELLGQSGWCESRVSYWVTKDVRLIRKTMVLPPAEQKQEIEATGEKPIFSYGSSSI